MCRALLLYALLPVSWAVWKRRPGARLALAGVLIGLGSVQQAADLRAILSPSYFLFFGVLVVMLLCALGLQMQGDRRHARAAQLAAARLETELLKKNLQPHFLFNTLAVLTEIVEQDPRSAVKLIDDLADEFRSVARVSAEKLIPFAQEIDLCRAHLRVMSVRTGRTWSLDAEGVDVAALVPPAVFLTLIENGFAHQRATDGAAVFRLRTERTADGRARYTFLSPGEVQTDSTRSAGGTGLRYVKARFEESFPGKWTLVDGAVAGGWQTVIEIKHRAEGDRA
jgi:LytS/YehU family sensor histidine kinase